MKMTGRCGFVLLVASLAFCAAVSAEQVRQGQITEVRGEVLVRLQGGDWKPAEMGMMLKEKDEIRTAKGGFAEIVLDGGDVGRLELKENSHFRVNTLGLNSSGDKVTLLDLAIGKVLVHAEKLRGDSKFEVRTPTSTTGVRGTEFEVSVEPKS